MMVYLCKFANQNVARGPVDHPGQKNLQNKFGDMI